MVNELWLTGKIDWLTKSVMALIAGATHTEYTISVTSPANGTIGPSGEIKVPEGSNKSFSFAADGGYTLSDVLVDGVSVGSVESYTFENVIDNHTIAAVFEVDEENPLPVEQGGTGTKTPKDAFWALATPALDVNEEDGEPLSLDFGGTSCSSMAELGGLMQGVLFGYTFNSSMGGSPIPMGYGGTGCKTIQELGGWIMGPLSYGLNPSMGGSPLPASFGGTGCYDTAGLGNWLGGIFSSTYDTRFRHGWKHQKTGPDALMLDATQIVSGVFDIARLPASAVPKCYVAADDSARFALTTADVQNGDTVVVSSTLRMYAVIDDTQLGVEAGYVEYKASADWSVITNKPAAFMPSSHMATHATGGADEIAPAAIGAATADHTHSGYLTASLDSATGHLTIGTKVYDLSSLEVV